MLLQVLLTGDIGTLPLSIGWAGWWLVVVRHVARGFLSFLGILCACMRHIYYTSWRVAQNVNPSCGAVLFWRVE